jgi:hypothetical protein
MRDVVGYVHRHQAQKPEYEVIENSRWATLTSPLQTQRTPDLRFSATLGQEPKVELGLV